MRSFCSALLVGLMLMPMPALAEDDDTRTYDVSIVFIGLMTFDRGDAAGDPVTVIIPNVSKETPVQGNHVIPAHVTYLLADRDAMRATDPINVHYEFEETPHLSDSFVYLPIDGVYISVDEENDVAALNRPLKYDNDDCKICPGRNNGTNDNGKLCWLSGMSQTKEGKQVKDPAHFARHAPGLSRKVIAGRMVIRYGDLNSYVVSLSARAPQFDFRRPNGSLIFARALAQETHWTFKARGLPFILNLDPIKPGGHSEQVAFMPTFDEAGQPGKLYIIIGNTMARDAGPLATPAKADIDQHYAIYYTFIDGNSDGLGALPTPSTDACGFVVNCTQFIYQPILSELVAAKSQGLPMPRGMKFLNPKTGKPDDACTAAQMRVFARKQKAAAAHTLAADHEARSAPGGLNCSGNQWP